MSVQRAVLGELVEKSDYAYGLARKVNASQASIYQATDRLLSLGHIEPAGAAGQRNYYRATRDGIAAYRELVAQEIAGQREKFEARLRRAVPEEIPAIFDEYESWLIGEMRSKRHIGTDMTSRLVALQHQVTNKATLQYIERARQLLSSDADV